MAADSVVMKVGLSAVNLVQKMADYLVALMAGQRVLHLVDMMVDCSEQNLADKTAPELVVEKVVQKVADLEQTKADCWADH